MKIVNPKRVINALIFIYAILRDAQLNLELKKKVYGKKISTFSKLISQ